MPEVVNVSIIPKPDQGSVVLYNSNEVSGTLRVAWAIETSVKKLPLIGVAILHVTSDILSQYAKQPSPKLVTDFGMMIEEREEQPEKHQDPTLVTDSGILIVMRDVQLPNVPSSKLVRVEGIVTDRRDSQPWKQRWPTLVTDSGILIDSRPAPANALFAKLVKDDGRVIDLRS